MIHNVAPPRSDELPTAPPITGVDAPPGPITWDIEAGPPLAEAEGGGEGPAPGDVTAVVPRRPSWDSVPHPVGQPAEPPRAAATPAGVQRDPVRPSPPPGDPGPPATPWWSAAPLTATAVHSLGPVGRRRSSFLAFLAAVLTLGLHPVLWIRRANLEMSQFDPRMVVRPRRSAAALAAVTAVPLLLAGAEIARVVADRLGRAPSLPINASATRWLVAAPALTPLLAVLVPFSLVALAMTLERVRVVEDRAGVDPEQQLSPAGSVWLAALPLVGLALVVSRAQQRLNRVWDACAGPGGR